jgi:ketosteroid isomerase-like protein
VCSSAAEDVAAAAMYLVDRDNERDLEGVLAGYTDDIVWLPPSGETVVGKAEIGLRYSSLFSEFQPHLKAQVLQSTSAEDLGFMVGVTSGTLQSLDDGSVTAVNDKFLAVVRCEGGTWRVSHLAWNPRSSPAEDHGEE